MTTPNGQRQAEGRTTGAEIPSRQTNAAAESKDTRYTKALEAAETAQAALEDAHLLEEDHPDRLHRLAEAYDRRARAWAELAEALPMRMPLSHCTALYVAATADAARARDYREWAAERQAGDNR